MNSPSPRAKHRVITITSVPNFPKWQAEFVVLRMVQRRYMTRVTLSQKCWLSTIHCNVVQKGMMSQHFCDVVVTLHAAKCMLTMNWRFNWCFDYKCITTIMNGPAVNFAAYSLTTNFQTAKDAAKYTKLASNG